MTVRLGEGDLLLTMSRDEQRARAAELPPQLHPSGALVFAAPTDPTGGGTWIFLRADGVAGALLNRYQDSYRPAAPRSRGLLMTDLASHPEPGAYLREPIGGIHVESYSPFTLLYFAEGCAVRFEWNGVEFASHHVPEGWSAFSSSSWNAAEVLPWRAAEFEQWRARGHAFAGALPDHHLLDPPGKAEWAPMMSREKTCTRSITQLEVSRANRVAAMRYWPAEDARAGRAPAQLELPFIETPT